MHDKQKLDLFNIKYSYWVMVDLLKLFDKEVNGASANDDYYILYINKLQHMYKQALKEEVPIIQKDLEDEINELKNENR